ncbi:MAG: ThuA domain-containing protein, partial [Pseudomonadota bacterium]
MTEPVSILLLTKGHPFEKGPLLDWMDSIPGAEITHIEHPAAHDFIAAGLGASYDLWLHYDMPGYRFGGDNGVEFVEPSQAFKNAYLDRLLNQGRPCLYLHHALAGWPTWPDYGEIVGGRFLYRPGTVRGAEVLDSGYRHEVTYTATLAEHPVTSGIEPAFDVTDELYLAEIFEADVVPIARSSYAFTASNFYSAA